jgi:predicted MFS family arabinose efflux permease
VSRDPRDPTISRRGSSTRAESSRLVPLYVASGILTLGEGGVLVLLSPYLESRGLTEAAIGTVVSIYGIASLVTRLPAGFAYASGRATPLISGGCLLSGLAFILLPATSNPLLLGALVALDGVGFAAATTGVMAGLIERRPAEADAGSVMGWYSGSMGAGYAVSGFVAGSAGDAVGIAGAILLLAAVPLAASFLLPAALRAARPLRSAAPDTESLSGRLRALVRAPAAVWLAFLVTLYINLVSGVLFTFFPLYGLAIGLSLTQIGLLAGIHGTLATTVRFFSGVIFGWISYRGSLPIMVVTSGVAVAALGGLRLFVALVIAWATIGFARGILRVASGALVLDEAAATGSQRGGASAIYLAGLDLGKVIGPLIGGLGAEVAGLPATFVGLGVAFPIVYLGLASLVSRRRTRAASPA